MAWDAKGNYVKSDDYHYTYELGQQVHPFTREGGLPGPLAQVLGRMPSASEQSEPTPCGACGAPVAAGEGAADGPWRLHTQCSPLSAHTVVTALLRAHPRLGKGVTLTPADAELLKDAGALRGLSFATSEGMPRTSLYRKDEKPAKAWAHVSREQIERLREGIAKLPSLRAKAGLTATTSTTGPCAWCGRRTSRGWADREHRWADGSSAPLCSSCSAIFDKYAYDLWASDWSSQRGALAEAITGVPCMLGESGPDTLKAYAELDVGARLTPPEQPWEHLDAATIESYRWDRWGAYPRYAPPEHREEAVARWQRKEKLREMRRAAAARAQSERQQTYRF